MKIPSTHQEYLDLCREIRLHDKHYYVEHQPLISDEKYDVLFRSIVDAEKSHPEWVTTYSPTQRVGEALTEGFKTAAHKSPMLSLANTYSKEEVADFIKRIYKLTANTAVEFSCELKMDGIAVSVTYEKGFFVRGVTRGDGKRGDDITLQIKTITSLPLQLSEGNVPDVLEVRGEVFLPHQAFEKLNQERYEAGEPLWANPRNAAAGSLKLLDPREVAKRPLAIVFYGIAEDSTQTLKKQSEVPMYLEKLGLPVLKERTKCKSLDDIWDFVEKVRGIRSDLPFDIDGIVIKLDDLKEQSYLGVAGKNPRWAVAYKFAAEQATTRIRGITVQVGRTGVLTPVAELEPVFLAGSRIARATLHNEEEVQRKDIRIGDMVTIEKGGDVIPKVVSVNLLLRPKETIAWSMPTHCPSCGTPVERVPGEVAVRCPNVQTCQTQRLRHIRYFASKEAFDIEEMGEKVVEQLVQRGFVTQPSDLFKLTENELSQLEGFKEKSIQNLLEGIARSKEVSLSRFIMGLGIKHVGSGTAELLAKKAGSLDVLSKMSIEELLSIEGIGDKMAQSIVDYFASSHNQEEIADLLAMGVHPQQVEVQILEGHPFNQKTFVLTGSLEKYTRAAAAALIKERGGKVTESVTKKTDYVLVGADPGSKLEKAQKLGVTILTEQDFEDLVL